LGHAAHPGTSYRHGHKQPRGLDDTPTQAETEEEPMNKTPCTLLLTASAMMAANVSLADTLPDNAMKLTATEARSLYAGRSSNWSEARAYFAPDGTYLIHAKDKTWFGEGRWTARGNKVCAEARFTSVKDGTKSNGGKVHCWTWYKAGKKYVSIWSGEAGNKDGYCSCELQKR
jgi:Protein of unknown function (DUF995)